MWKIDLTVIPLQKDRIFITIPVWIKTNLGNRYLATYHSGNGFFYPLNEIYGKNAPFLISTPESRWNTGFSDIGKNNVLESFVEWTELISPV